MFREFSSIWEIQANIPVGDCSVQMGVIDRLTLCHGLKWRG